VQPIHKLALKHLPMDSPDFSSNPFLLFDEARAIHPWLAKFSFGYVITEYRAVRDLMAMEGRLRTPYGEMVDMIGARDTVWGRFQSSHISACNGAEHMRLRKILQPALTPKQANAYRPMIRKVMNDLLDRWGPSGAFDFEEFVSWFTQTVICRMVGVSSDAILSLRASLNMLALSVNMKPGDLVHIENATQELDHCAHLLIAAREAGAPDEDDPDFLGVLLAARADGNMTTREIADMIMFFIISGFGTSKNVLTRAMHQLLQRPDLYSRCSEELAFCGKVIDETMRLHATTTSPRLLTDDIVYRDVGIPADTVLWFPWSVIARDPSVADDAAVFQPDRDKKIAHLGFALGSHMCIGQYFARAQMEEGLHMIAQRILRPRSAGPGGWWPFLGTWGIKGLPIEFDWHEAWQPA